MHAFKDQFLDHLLMVIIAFGFNSPERSINRIRFAIGIQKGYDNTAVVPLIVAPRLQVFEVCKRCSVRPCAIGRPVKWCSVPSIFASFTASAKS